jgi:hypothetical protein
LAGVLRLSMVVNKSKSDFQLLGVFLAATRTRAARQSGGPELKKS